MDMNLVRRVAVVTGVSSDIGKAVALRLASEGCTAIVGVSESAESIREEINEVGRKAGCFWHNGMYRTVGLDLSSDTFAGDVADLALCEFPKIDILVNNANVTRDNLMVRMDANQRNEVIDMNLRAPFLLTKGLTRDLRKSDCGRIVNISSAVGLAGSPWQAEYYAPRITKCIRK